MIPNCKGCEEEFRQAMFAQNLEGYYFVTSLEREYIGCKHFMIYMVDDDGDIKYE